MYPGQFFRNSGLTGNEHMTKARKRALDWFEMHWNHGYIEFYSNVYHKEDIGPLMNLIDFADDNEIVTKGLIEFLQKRNITGFKLHLLISLEYRRKLNNKNSSFACPDFGVSFQMC